MAAELNTDPEELATDAKSVARGLHRLVEGDLAGMFDRASTTKVECSGPGIVIDLSAVLQSPAFSAILVCAGAWLAQVVAAKDRQRIIVVDECWKAIRDAGFVAWGEETQKLSRAYGVQLVTIVQRISDLASQADDGTTTSKRAQGFVTEAETKVTFNLGGGEARASRDVMDWTESEALLVPKLPRGRALWRVGEHGAIVQTILSPPRHRHVRFQSGHAEPAMSPAVLRHLTWSRVGVAVSVALIAFGAVVALLPRHHAAAGPLLVPVAGGRQGNRLSDLGAQELAAQQTAERFVIACDTTDPANPAGDVATETALGPGLVVPHDVVWPAAWRTEDRRTTVVLDPPGQPLAERGDMVAVIVTGTMTVTSDSGPPQIVPLAERIALHLYPMMVEPPAGRSSASRSGHDTHRGQDSRPPRRSMCVHPVCLGGRGPRSRHQRSFAARHGQHPRQLVGPVSTSGSSQ